VDALFAAGVDRVAYDLNVWNEGILEQACPGIFRHIGRAQQLRALEYAAQRHGPNKTCSAFVIGLEPLDSLLAGAEYVARRGIVPLFSIWLPHHRPVRGSTAAPALDYYRRARQGFVELFARYDLEPPGASGLNVCMCRDLILQPDVLDFNTAPAGKENNPGHLAGRDTDGRQLPTDRVSKRVFGMSSRSKPGYNAKSL
jgi:hypothetical protein